MEYKKKRILKIILIIGVISIVLLFIGFILLRTGICKGSIVYFTKDINGKVENEINSIFETSESEVVCIGSQEAETMTQGENYVYCGISSPQGGRYEIKLVNITSINMPKNINLSDWVPNGRDSWGPREVATNSKEIIRAITLEIPEDAPKRFIRLNVEVYKDEKLISTMDLDFKISRTSVVKSILC